VAEAQYTRESDLHESGISPLRSLQKAEEDRDASAAAVAMASGTLSMIGADEEGDEGFFTLRSPIDGVVTERHHSVGEFIPEEVPIFEVLDPTVLWADIDIPELHAARVRIGQPVELAVDGTGGRIFLGRIDYVAPVVDPGTRTVQARALFDNSDGALRANTYGSVRILAQTEGSGALVPRTALQDAKGVQVVFVPISDTEFETRRVRTAPGDGDLVQVMSGVDPGERVVTTGSFLLKTETLKGSIGAGCCEAPGGER
jgi:cobalt-zinc-cadmium efflux system membrane fusion protein